MSLIIFTILLGNIWMHYEWQRIIQNSIANDYTSVIIFALGWACHIEKNRCTIKGQCQKAAKEQLTSTEETISSKLKNF